MKMWITAAAGLALLAGGVAAAQTPPANAGPPSAPAEGPSGGPAEHPPMGGPEGMRFGPHFGPMGRMMRMRPPSSAAHFRFRKDDALVDIKCADNESTKACTDAATALLDKLATQPK